MAVWGSRAANRVYGDEWYGSRCNIAGEIVQMRMKCWVMIFEAVNLTTRNFAKTVYCAKERKEVNKRGRFCKESMLQPTWHHFQIVWQYSHLVGSSREPDRELKLVIKR